MMTAPFRQCPIEAVIFDLDGTLLDSAAQIAAAINVLFRACGLETFYAGEIAHHIGWGSRKLIKLASASLPGAINLIGALAERELRLGICTNKQEGIARAILEEGEASAHVRFNHWR